MDPSSSVLGHLAWEYSQKLSDSLNNIGIVYHYTSANGFQRILAKKKFKTNSSEEAVVCLMLSDIRCLNDSSENTEAYALFKETLREMKNDIKVGFYKQLYQLKEPDTPFVYYDPNRTTNSMNKQYNSIEFAQSRRYVCCFSKKRDYLPMWNYYVKNSRYEGYCIGLNLEKLRRKMNVYIDTRYQVNIARMIYKQDTKKDIIKGVISRINAVWHNGITKEIIQQHFQDYLWTWNILFKNEAFSHEEEVRIVVDIPIKNGINAVEPKNEPDKIEVMYRIQHGLMTPYIFLHFDPNSLESIVIGPFTNSREDKKVQETNVHSYLKDNGFSITGDNVKCSEIPVRF